jgi:hypothetical protein
MFLDFVPRVETAAEIVYSGAVRANPLWSSTLRNSRATRDMSHKPPDKTTPYKPRRRIPRSFRDLTPSNHFSPGTFFIKWCGRP